MQTEQYRNPEFWQRKPIRWEFNNAAEDDWFIRELKKA